MMSFPAGGRLAVFAGECRLVKRCWHETRTWLFDVEVERHERCRRWTGLGGRRERAEVKPWVHSFTQSSLARPPFSFPLEDFYTTRLPVSPRGPRSERPLADQRRRGDAVVHSEHLYNKSPSTFDGTEYLNGCGEGPMNAVQNEGEEDIKI